MTTAREEPCGAFHSSISEEDVCARCGISEYHHVRRNERQRRSSVLSTPLMPSAARVQSRVEPSLPPFRRPTHTPHTEAVVRSSVAQLRSVLVGMTPENVQDTLVRVSSSLQRVADEYETAQYRRRLQHTFSIPYQSRVGVLSRKMERRGSEPLLSLPQRDQVGQWLSNLVSQPSASPRKRRHVQGLMGANAVTKRPALAKMESVTKLARRLRKSAQKARKRSRTTSLGSASSATSTSVSSAADSEKPQMHRSNSLGDVNALAISRDVLAIQRVCMAPGVQASLSTFGEWDFDIFGLARECPRNVITVSMRFLFMKLNLFDAFHIPPHKFLNFMNQLDAGYMDNPYHNSVHGVDVVGNVYYWMASCAPLQECLSPIDVFAGLIAAAVHDFRHPGTNNLFHVNTESPLALQYNDVSVLENFHVAEAFSLLKNPENDILSGLTTEQRRQFRSRMVGMVLATDMSKHSQSVSDLRTLGSRCGEEGGVVSLVKKEPQVLTTLMESLLHLADLGNPTKNLKVCKEWSERITEEFFQQGDQEKRLGLEASPMTDRGNHPPLAASQIGFMDFIIQPMFSAWSELFPQGSQVCMQHLDRNKQYWVNALRVHKLYNDPEEIVRRRSEESVSTSAS